MNQQFSKVRSCAVLAVLAVLALGGACSAERSNQVATPRQATGVTNSTAPSGTSFSRGGPAPSPGAIDPSHIPMGDGDFITTEGKRGFVLACDEEFRGGGADHLGPWAQDGYWDSTAKPTVDGSVEWPRASASFMVTGEARVIKTLALPITHPTGVFPIDPSDDAYEYDRNPNAISAQDVTVSLPVGPTMAATPTCVRGAVGYLLSGVPMYSALDAAGRDAAAHEIQDECGGHPHRGGVYHYHALSSCLDDVAVNHDLQGYALDGFGIFGLRDDVGVELTNSDLDECHGHSHSIAWDQTTLEMFHYHLTREYPYSVGCYRGTPVDSGPVGVGAGPPDGPPPARN